MIKVYHYHLVCTYHQNSGEKKSIMIRPGDPETPRQNMIYTLQRVVCNASADPQGEHWEPAYVQALVWPADTR